MESPTTGPPPPQGTFNQGWPKRQQNYPWHKQQRTKWSGPRPWQKCPTAHRQLLLWMLQHKGCHWWKSGKRIHNIGGPGQGQPFEGELLLDVLGNDKETNIVEKRPPNTTHEFPQIRHLTTRATTTPMVKATATRQWHWILTLLINWDQPTARR